MKKLLIIWGATLGFPALSIAAEFKAATVTRTVNDVKIYRPSAFGKEAQVGDTVSGKESVQTGRRSRAELRFQDNSMTRLGANSIFSFDQGSRDLKLERGIIFLSVPSDAGGARIRTATVTAAVTGTTIMMEYYSEKWVKIIVLEGSLDTWVDRQNQRTKKTIRSGQMVVLKPDDRRMPGAVDIDLRRLLRTSGLADKDTFGDLPAAAAGKIAQSVQDQDQLKSRGVLVPLIQGADGPGSGGPGLRGGGGAGQVERLPSIGKRVPPTSGPRQEGDNPGR